jgi:hypothetical protein
MVVAVKQFFTHRAVPPAPAPVPAPAAPPPPIPEAGAPVQGTNPAPPPSPPALPESPDAAEAGYQSRVVPVGGTSLRLYARSTNTLDEIQGILGQPGLLSGKEIMEQLEIVNENLSILGFESLCIGTIAAGLCTGPTYAFASVEGNETKRQEILRSRVESERANAGLFQSCQPPDKAKIAGARVFAEMNFLFQTLATCAAKGKKGVKQQVAGQELFMEGFLKICNNPKNQIVILERYAEGNLMTSPRIYVPLLAGCGDALGGCLQGPHPENPDEKIFSCKRLQVLAKDHGPEFVERLVQTTYKIKKESRSDLRTAYEEYHAQAGRIHTDLDKLLFNDPIRTMLSSEKQIDKFIKEHPGLSPEKKGELRAQPERNFQTWLSANKIKEADGSFTIDVGHKIITVNDDQLKKVTLQSLTNL